MKRREWIAKPDPGSGEDILVGPTELGRTETVRVREVLPGDITISREEGKVYEVSADAIKQLVNELALTKAELTKLQVERYGITHRYGVSYCDGRMLMLEEENNKLKKELEQLKNEK